MEIGSHPIDRLIDQHLAEYGLPRPELIDDATFLRRVHLDLVGLFPTPEQFGKVSSRSVFRQTDSKSS